MVVLVLTERQLDLQVPGVGGQMAELTDEVSCVVEVVFLAGSSIGFIFVVVRLKRLDWC